MYCYRIGSRRCWKHFAILKGPRLLAPGKQLDDWDGACVGTSCLARAISRPAGIPAAGLASTHLPFYVPANDQYPTFLR